MKRRSFLKMAAIGSLSAGAFATSTSAVHDTKGQPSHVTLSFDEPALEQYRPRLVTGHLDVRPTKQYAWLATSPEEDDDAYCYWTFYVTQRGVTSRDSHYLDREPIYVFVDGDTGEISEVVYSAYHWLAGRTRSPHVFEDGDGEHPTFRVAKNWHHYLQTTETDGVFVDLGDLNDQFESWLANGWEDDLCIGCAKNPWKLRFRDSWWKDDRSGGIGEFFARMQIRVSSLPGINIRGGGNTDL